MINTVGIVLAAGASRRMGAPKALLPTAYGVPLAVRQAGTLEAGGCALVAVVLGARAEVIQRRLPPDLLIIDNGDWARGRATSLQAGIRGTPRAKGYLFLPVDAAGVAPRTIRKLLVAATGEPESAWRLTHKGQRGNLLWLPRRMASRLLKLEADARIDEWVEAKGRERSLEVSDRAILNNINTPEDWEEIRRKL